MAKPMPMDDEEDALSMVMGAASDGEEGEEVSEELAETPEAESEGGADQLLNEISAKLEQLRGLVSSV